MTGRVTGTPCRCHIKLLAFLGWREQKDDTGGSLCYYKMSGVGGELSVVDTPVISVLCVEVTEREP